MEIDLSLNTEIKKLISKSSLDFLKAIAPSKKFLIELAFREGARIFLEHKEVSDKVKEAMNERYVPYKKGPSFDVSKLESVQFDAKMDMERMLGFLSSHRDLLFCDEEIDYIIENQQLIPKELQKYDTIFPNALWMRATKAYSFDLRPMCFRSIFWQDGEWKEQFLSPLKCMNGKVIREEKKKGVISTWHEHVYWFPNMRLVRIIAE